MGALGLEVISSSRAADHDGASQATKKRSIIKKQPKKSQSSSCINYSAVSSRLLQFSMDPLKPDPRPHGSTFAVAPFALLNSSHPPVSISSKCGRLRCGSPRSGTVTLADISHYTSPTRPLPRSITMMACRCFLFLVLTRSVPPRRPPGPPARAPTRRRRTPGRTTAPRA